MAYCGSITRISIVDVTVISDMLVLWACGMQAKSMCICMHLWSGSGISFSSSAGHVIIDV